ncbi:MAG: CdaR family protein [Peptococcaceae bacterium]|nr:CdaR family protein [Peptococcaceae bacterium]
MKITENNRALKLVALAIAIVLWLYVGIEQDPISQRTYNVPITVENLSADKVATVSKERVNVKVMGRETRLDGITSEDFKAYVDLSDAKTGDSEAEVHVSLPNEVYFAKLDPSHVNVYVEQREGETMNVDIVRTGMLPDGITIEDMSVEPQNVFVSGNEDALAMVAKVGVAVELDDIYSDSKKDVPVQLYDYEGNIIEQGELKVYPEQVTLNIKVNEADIQKSVPIQAELVGSLSEGVQVDSVTVDPQTAMVEGLPKDLAKITEIKTEPIDLSGIKETTSFTVKLVGKQLRDVQKVTVTVNVSEQAEDDVDGKVYTKVVPIAITGAAADRVTASDLLAEVTYHMQPGYADTGDNLTAFVQVDEAPESSITVDVQFGVIEGLVIDSVTPSTITLNLMN